MKGLEGKITMNEYGKPGDSLDTDEAEKSPEDCEDEECIADNVKAMLERQAHVVRSQNLRVLELLQQLE